MSASRSKCHTKTERCIGSFGVCCKRKRRCMTGANNGKVGKEALDCTSCVFSLLLCSHLPAVAARTTGARSPIHPSTIPRIAAPHTHTRDTPALTERMPPCRFRSPFDSRACSQDGPQEVIFEDTVCHVLLRIFLQEMIAAFMRRSLAEDLPAGHHLGTVQRCIYGLVFDARRYRVL